MHKLYERTRHVLDHAVLRVLDAHESAFGAGADPGHGAGVASEGEGLKRLSSVMLLALSSWPVADAPDDVVDYRVADSVAECEFLVAGAPSSALLPYCARVG